MLINTGTQERVLMETTVGAGQTSHQGSIRSDSLVATLWVDSVVSGTLDITFYTLTDEGKEVELFHFPTLSAGSSSLLLKKSGVSLQRFRVAVTYSGVCSYEVYVRAISGIGDSTTKLVGADLWTAERSLVSTTPLLVVAAALVDRQGVLVKNWSTTLDLYLAPNVVDCTPNGGSYPLAPRDALALDVNAGAEVYAVTSSGTADVRVTQARG